MQSTQALDFHPTFWTLTLSVIVMLVVLGLAWVAIERHKRRAGIWILESLRVVIVFIALILLNQPEWTEEFRPSEKPTVLVLGDASLSMSTKDVGNETRSSAITSLLQSETWSSISDRYQIDIQTFSKPDATSGSDITSPLQEASDRIQNLRAVVLASDGDWNKGGSPVEVASKLRMQNVPIIGVPVGSNSQLPDLEILSFELPTFGISGKTVRIPFTIESSLPRAVPTTVTLTSSDGTSERKEVIIQPMGRTTDSISWKPTTTGETTLTIAIPTQADELIAENNERSAPIAIREEKLKVLVIESYPRWEYRYLRNALSRDPGVEVSCLLFHPGLSKVGGGNRDYISEFPNELEELSKYDVVFLGDVGIEQGQLTEEQCRLLKGLVQQQASGLVFMPGWKGYELSLINSPLNDLLPVVMDQGQIQGWGSRTPQHFELTELGRRSLLTRLADTQQDNLNVWENLPGFQWYAGVVRAKAGTEVLAVHQEVSNANGRLPLLATKTYGAGKVLFMGTDGAWRWRKGVEDKYHYRFWGQVVRWMAYQRNMAKGETMRLFYSPEQPLVRQTLFLNANVVEKNGEPLSKGEVTANIIAPSGLSQTIRLSGNNDEWGAYTGQVTPSESGMHKVLLRCKETDSVLETSIFVQGAALERVGKPARPEVIQELVSLTRGHLAKPDQVAQILQTLQNLPDPPLQTRRLQLWNNASMAALLITLLATFWVARKWIGLI